MHVRLLTGLVSPSGQWFEGDQYETDPATAERMIRAGQALPWSVGGVELAVGSGGVERAVKPKGRGRDV